VNRCLKKLLFAAYLPVVTLILLEIGVRLWGYSEHYIYDPIYVPFDETEDIPFVHRPDVMHARGRGLSVINTDSLGLRSETAGARYGSKKDGEYRIAVAGDSVAFGYGVKRTEDTFCQVLEDILNQRQGAVRVQVFNYGVSGYSVKEMAATLRYRMLELEPDLVLMAIIPPDFDLSRTPIVDKWGYTASDMSGFVPRDSIVKRTLRRVRLVYVLRDLRYQWFERGQHAQNQVIEGRIPESYRYAKQFARIAEGQDLSYSLILLPSIQWGLVSFGDLPEQLDQDKIDFVDLSTLRKEFTLDQFRASKFDVHPSAMVHRRIGEALADYVLEEHLRTPQE
jgi:lysophospholipase L1-like esterase